MDPTTLKLKVVLRCGDLKVLTKAVKSCPGAKDLNSTDCALESSKLFGSTWNLDLPLGVDCNSHRHDKVNDFNSHHSSWAIRECIIESLMFAKYGAVHTMLIMENSCLDP